MPVRVLCAVEPAELARKVQRYLREPAVLLVPDAGASVLQALGRHDAELVVVSRHLVPDPVEAWVREVRGLPENPEVVVIHQREEPKLRAALLRAGCLAVLFEALPESELGATLEALVRRRQQQSQLFLRAQLPPERSNLTDFVSESPRMREFMAVARRVVGSGSSLLITGETGTGKERLARAIHGEGPRSAGPFLAVNCGALPESLLESELFGHEKGAFTGASRSRKGYFEQAEGGTIFLDEIGELPLHLQVKLLRVIEEHRVQRVGGERSVGVDVRVMAATNRDLEAEVEGKRFRADLYYRLAVVTLDLPPLRDRKEDIPALVRNYLEHFRMLLNQQVYGVTSDALRALVAYSWPGNVRELINVTERAVLLGSGPEIGLTDLPRVIEGRFSVEDDRRLLDGLNGGGILAGWRDKPLSDARREVMAAFERSYVTALLEESKGRIGDAARRAGINERSLYELMKRHRLSKERFRAPSDNG